MHCPQQQPQPRPGAPGRAKAGRRRYKTFMIDEILSKETCDYFEKLSLYSVCPSLLVRPKPLHSCAGKRTGEGGSPEGRGSALPAAPRMLRAPSARQTAARPAAPLRVPGSPGPRREPLFTPQPQQEGLRLVPCLPGKGEDVGEGCAGNRGAQRRHPAGIPAGCWRINRRCKRYRVKGSTGPAGSWGWVSLPGVSPSAPLGV